MAKFARSWCLIEGRFTKDLSGRMRAKDKITGKIFVANILSSVFLNITSLNEYMYIRGNKTLYT